MNKKNDYDIVVLSKILDSQFKTPWGFRFGLDGLLGLIPGVGDFSTSALSLYIVFRAVQLGLPSTTLLLMLKNLAIENLVQAIPFLGNIFDFFWKANIRNLKLIQATQNKAKTLQERTSKEMILTSLWVLFLGIFLVLFSLASSSFLILYLFGFFH